MSSENKTEPKWSQLTVKDKFVYFIKNITVEPVLVCHVLPSVISALAVQNLILEKACRVNLRYSDEVCDALSQRNTTFFKEEEIRVQQTVASMAVWKMFLHSFFPTVLIMFVGSWSDRRRKRKLCMMFPMLGDFLAVMGLLWSYYFFYELPMEVTGFVHGFFQGITGGWTTMFMGIFSYLSEVTTEDMRMVRIGAAHMFISGSVPFGTALSGIFLKYLGFYGVFLISASGYIVGLAYGIFRIKEPTAHLNDICSPDLSEKSPTKTPVELKWNMLHFLKDFFDLNNIRDTFSVILKEGKNNRRKRIIFLIVVLIVVSGPLQGEMTVMYLFMRYRFNWDEVQYSMFSTYSVITHLIGTSFSVGVFSHLLKIDDALIGVISCTSKILAGFMYAYAQTEWQVYLAPLLDIVNGTSYIAMRSIASKLVPPEELGKLNSLYGACESLTPLLYGPMYAFVYAKTMDTMPGAFFILGGALTLPAIAIFWWMYLQHQGDRQYLMESRKSSLAEEVLKNFRVETFAVSPSILQATENQVELPEMSGKINQGFQED